MVSYLKTIKLQGVKMPGHFQILLVILLVVVLFGFKKLPDMARSLGKAKGEFKKGLLEGEQAEKEAREQIDQKKLEEEAK